MHRLKYSQSSMRFSVATSTSVLSAWTHRRFPASGSPNGVPYFFFKCVSGDDASLKVLPELNAFQRRYLYFRSVGPDPSTVPCQW